MNLVDTLTFCSLVSVLCCILLWLSRTEDLCLRFPTILLHFLSSYVKCMDQTVLTGTRKGGRELPDCRSFPKSKFKNPDFLDTMISDILHDFLVG